MSQKPEASYRIAWSLADAVLGEFENQEVKMNATIRAGILAGGALLVISGEAVLSQASAAGGVRNVVLVHGGFVDGSGWEGVYKALKKDGYAVTIVQNPTLSLADDVAVTMSRGRMRSLLSSHGPPGARSWRRLGSLVHGAEDARSRSWARAMSWEARRTFDPRWIRRAVVQNVVSNGGVRPALTLSSREGARRSTPR